MGMFDSIILTMNCPYCFLESNIECQTKELDCYLNVFKQGDYIGTDQYNFLNCIADCQTQQCKEYTINKIGYSSGFGRHFYVKVYLHQGIVTGKFKIIQKDNDDEETRKVIIEKY